MCGLACVCVCVCACVHACEEWSIFHPCSTFAAAYHVLRLLAGGLCAPPGSGTMPPAPPTPAAAAIAEPTARVVLGAHRRAPSQGSSGAMLALATKLSLFAVGTCSCRTTALVTLRSIDVLKPWLRPQQASDNVPLSMLWPMPHAAASVKPAANSFSHGALLSPLRRCMLSYRTC